MAERIVSPGVFTNEKDLSFLPEGISDIGAALIANLSLMLVPTIIRNFGEFETLFGKESQDSMFLSQRNNIFVVQESAHNSSCFRIRWICK